MTEFGGMKMLYILVCEKFRQMAKRWGHVFQQYMTKYGVKFSDSLTIRKLNCISKLFSIVEFQTCYATGNNVRCFKRINKKLSGLFKGNSNPEVVELSDYKSVLKNITVLSGNIVKPSSST